MKKVIVSYPQGECKLNNSDGYIKLIVCDP